MTLLCVLCAGAAAALVPRPMPARAGPRPTASRSWSGPATAGVVVVAGALLATAEGTWLALGLILLAASAATLRLVATARRRTLALRREERVVEVCEVLAAELRAGQPPTTAVEHCAEVWPDFASVAVAARLGADVPTALRRLAQSPGAAGLRDVAGAWAVSQGAGAGLSIALGQVATSARESQTLRRLVVSELSSAQATARLVAALPLVTLVMGAGIGGDPWGFLLRTPPGLVCLAAGLGIAFLGLVWIERIAATVMRR
ncbi:MAG TPA: type II secretion system F family protein [Nocardioidaceae bacterium]|nr:type II secretion system F family protein [Nocardioidaceae bacterium]